MKRGQVLHVDITPTKTAWLVTITHRTHDGGVVEDTATHSKFQGVLAYVNRVVDTCGAER